MNELALPTEQQHDLNWYADLPKRDIPKQLRKLHGGLLMRGRLTTLLARREIGGLLFEFARRHPGDRAPFEKLAKETLDFQYSDARLHVQLWVAWSTVAKTLTGLEADAKRRGTVFTVPGLRRLLKLSGVTRTRRMLAGGVTLEAVVPAALPNEVEALKQMVRELQAENRVQRADMVELRGEIQHLRNRPGPSPSGTRYWRLPPDLYAELDGEFHFDFDPCPFPLPPGFNGLHVEWGKSNLVNPPFRKDDVVAGRGVTAFVRRAIHQAECGKSSLLMLPVPDYVTLLVEAGAEVRAGGRIKFLEADTNEPTKHPRNIAFFVLRPKG